MEESIIKMSIMEKIKTTNNKIEQTKVENDFDPQADKIAAFSSGDVGKYKFLTDKDVLLGKDTLEKAATMTRIEYLLFR